MLVVADSSPLSLLVEIGYADVLPALFQRVVIPPQVAGELSRPRTPQEVRDFVARPPAWLEIREPKQIEPLVQLGPGERAAISLACELNADAVLIDEKAGRRVAAERRLPVIGSVGVLERAADRGLLDLREAFQRVRATTFHVSERLLEQALERDVACRPPRRDT